MMNVKEQVKGAVSAIMLLAIVAFVSSDTIIDDNLVNTTQNMSIGNYLITELRLAGTDIRGADDINGTELYLTGAGVMTTLNTGQGANEVYAMDQDVEQADAVTFATLDTGQGANELYDMDQNVLQSSSPTFGSLTLTNTLTMPNNVPLYMKDTAGGTVQVIKINSANNTLIKAISGKLVQIPDNTLSMNNQDIASVGNIDTNTLQVDAGCTGNCVTGTINWNTTHICVCTTTNTWKSGALA